MIHTVRTVFSAMTLQNLPQSSSSSSPSSSREMSEVGAMLFTRGVSGTRVITGREDKDVEGHRFEGEMTPQGPLSSHNPIVYYCTHCTCAAFVTDDNIIVYTLIRHNPH